MGGEVISLDQIQIFLCLQADMSETIKKLRVRPGSKTLAKEEKG